MIADFNACRNPNNTQSGTVAMPAGGTFIFDSSAGPWQDGGCIGSITITNGAQYCDIGTGVNYDWTTYSSVNLYYKSPTASMTFYVDLTGYLGYPAIYGPITASVNWQCVTIPKTSFTLNCPCTSVQFFSNITDILIEPQEAGTLKIDNVTLSQ